MSINPVESETNPSIKLCFSLSPPPSLLSFLVLPSRSSPFVLLSFGLNEKRTTCRLLCPLQKLKLLLLNAKDKDKDPKTSSLMAHLRKIDEHLGRKGTRFLTGDTMCCFDCELMPRLQHIRVAGKYFADFEIPETLVHLWRYMHHMYRLDAFLQSCPADQDIINHYKLQQVRDANYVREPLRFELNN